MKKKQIIVTLRVTANLMERIDCAVKMSGRDQADLLREALDVGLDDLALIEFQPMTPAKEKIVALKSQNLRAAPDIIELPFLGAVAAGQPVSAPLNESVTVPQQYPEKHFVVEINGQSGEPDFMDGDRWVIDGSDCFTPKNGKPCIVSDESGSYLKKWNSKRRVFESINPKFNDVIPGEGAKLQGYPVEKLSHQ